MTITKPDITVSKYEKKQMCLANNLIKGEYKLSLMEHRILYLLLGVVNSSGEIDRKQVFYCDDYAESFGVDKHDFFTYMKEQIDTLFEAKIKFNGLTSEGFPITIMARWLTMVGFCEPTRVIYFSWSEDLMPYISKLGKEMPFTRLKFHDIKSLESVYSFRLYELVKLRGWARVQGSFSISVEALQEMWQVPTTCRQYKYFKRDILLPAMRELMDKKIVVLEIKSEFRANRKVTEIEIAWTWATIGDKR